jgi:hypothetical protein
VSEVGVIRLVWAELGPAPVERFVRSYREHPAGLDHKLVVYLVGYARPEDAENDIAALADIEHEVVFLERDLLDLPIYALAAEALELPTLCFMNWHTEVLVPNWLATLHSLLERPEVGVVGATGSYEATMSRLPWRRRRWPGFPNPHLRTNAFMLQRELMRSLQWPHVDNKRDAWTLESGYKGMTRQIQDRGLEVLIAGRDGKGYAPDEWPRSGTFRCGGQVNLLVADNRTRDWEQADPAEQERLTRLTWGPHAPVAAPDPRPTATPAPRA